MINKSITLKSIAGPEETIIYPKNITDGESVVRLGADASNTSVPGITFEGFTVKANQESSNIVQVWAEGEAGNPVTIRNNVVSSVDDWNVGINIAYGQDYVVIEDNMIVDDNPDPDDGLNYGIYLNGGGDIQILNNTIKDMVYPGIAIGRKGFDEFPSWIPHDITISGNSIIGSGTNTAYNKGYSLWDTGIIIYTREAHDIDISNNNIRDGDFAITTGAQGADADAADFSGIYINDNNFVNNSYDVYDLGIYHTVDATLDATNNWWGTTEESEIKNMIEGDVDYTDWLDEPVSDAGSDL